jgi:biotin carboxylase
MGAKTLLLVESGFGRYRRYAIESITKAGINLFLLTRDKVTWEAEYITGHLQVDAGASDDDVIEEVRKVHRRLPFDGLMTFKDLCVELTARLATTLDLPFITPDRAVKVRDKLAMRRAIREIGLITPRFQEVTLADAEQVIEDISFPCVLKPKRGYSSIDIFKLETEADIGKAIETIRASKMPGGFLVEEYIEGDELSVESLAHDGKVHHHGLVRKFKTPEPYFEELGHSTADEGHAAIFETVRRLITGLGLDVTATHTELKLSPRGPVIIEIGSRLAGDFIPRLFEVGKGVSPALCQAQAALRLPPALTWTRDQNATIGFFIPKGKAVIKGAPDPRDFVDPAIKQFVFDAEVGSRTALPPEEFSYRMGNVIVVDQDLESAKRRVNQVIDRVSESTGVELHRLT